MRSTVKAALVSALLAVIGRLLWPELSPWVNILGAAIAGNVVLSVWTRYRARHRRCHHLPLDGVSFNGQWYCFHCRSLLWLRVWAGPTDDTETFLGAKLDWQNSWFDNASPLVVEDFCREFGWRWVWITDTEGKKLL